MGTTKIVEMLLQSNLLLKIEYIDARTGLPTEINGFVKVFIIMGALLFAKQLPKLIQDLTGISLDGKFTINPFKKVAEVPLIGAAANRILGAADSTIHGNGFRAGWKRNAGKIAWTGGDGKTSIWDTADRRLRKEVYEKRDPARGRYEAKFAKKELDELLKKGEENYSKINATEIRIESEARINGQKQGLTGAELETYIATEKSKFKDVIARDKEKAERRLYGDAYYDSKKKVDDAKAKMYAWDNYVDDVRSAHNAAVLNYGENSPEARAAFNALEKAKKNAGSAKGQYERMQQEHKHYKTLNKKGAEVEDAVDAFEKMGGKEIDMPPNYQQTQTTGSRSNTATGGPTNGGPTNGGPTNGGPTNGGPTTNGPTNGGSTNGDSTTNDPTNGGSTSEDSAYDNSTTQDTSNENTNGADNAHTQSSSTTEQSQQQRIERQRRMERERETRKIREKAEEDFTQKHDVYLNNLNDPGLKVETKERMYKEYLEAEQTRERAIREHEIAVDALGELADDIPETVQTNTYVDEAVVKFTETIERIKNSREYQLRHYYIMPVDRATDDIRIVATKLMKLKENGIHAICEFDKIGLDNAAFESISDIERYYINKRNS